MLCFVGLLWNAQSVCHHHPRRRLLLSHKAVRRLKTKGTSSWLCSIQCFCSARLTHNLVRALLLCLQHILTPLDCTKEACLLDLRLRRSQWRHFVKSSKSKEGAHCMAIFSFGSRTLDCYERYCTAKTKRRKRVQRRSASGMLTA